MGEGATTKRDVFERAKVSNPRVAKSNHQDSQGGRSSGRGSVLKKKGKIEWNFSE